MRTSKKIGSIVFSIINQKTMDRLRFIIDASRNNRTARLYVRMSQSFLKSISSADMMLL
jgi:hypothetical protein